MLLADHGGFCDVRMIYERAFHLHGADPVTGHVHDVVHTTEQPEITVFIALGPIPGKILSRESAPIRLDVAIRIAEYRAHHRGPWLGKNEVAATAFGNALAMFVDHIGFDGGKRLGRGPGLQSCQTRQGRDQRMAGFGLPPGIQDWTAVASYIFLVPDPRFRIDRFSHSTEEPETLV